MHMPHSGVCRGEKWRLRVMEGDFYITNIISLFCDLDYMSNF